MARTVNVAVHAVRREAFVEAAQRLMQTKGYEQMSIQDLLDELDASRGASAGRLRTRGNAVFRTAQHRRRWPDSVLDNPGRRRSGSPGSGFGRVQRLVLGPFP